LNYAGHRNGAGLAVLILESLSPSLSKAQQTNGGGEKRERDEKESFAFFFSRVLNGSILTGLGVN
jgi:hypothetical protein